MEGLSACERECDGGPGAGGSLEKKAFNLNQTMFVTTV